MRTTDYPAAVLNSADVPIICSDCDGRITSWNPAAERILGYAAADVVGREISLLFPAEDHREEAATLMRVLRDEGGTTDHRVLVAKNGQRVALSVTTSPIRDAEGRVIGASKICREAAAQDHIPLAELYLGAIVASSDDVIISMNLDGTVQSWNPAGERLFGFTAAEMIGHSIRKIIPPARQVEEDDVLARVRAGVVVDHFETQRQAKNGEIVDISLTVSPIRDHSGRIIGASRIARDIRAQKRAALAGLHLGAIVASSDDVIISKDLDGTVQSWNPAAERLFGFTAAEMIGQSIRKIIPSARQAEEDDVLARVRAGLVVDHFETQRQAKNGELIEISLTVSPIRDGSGRVIGASKIARDVRAQKRAAVAALHLAALVHSSDDAIVSKDLNGIVKSWNSAAERLFGYDAAEMIGQSITKIVPTNRLDEETYVLSRIRAGLSLEHFETVRQTKDGRLVDISLTVSPILDETGRVIGASKIARDIREHKRLIEKSRVAAASEEAARREVLEAQNRRVQEAARLKSEFVANMSHELRTPLNSILGFAELIADARLGPLPDRYQTSAKVMHSSAQHLLQLINDILDLAKVESGRIDFQPEQVDLSQVVTETTAMISGLAAKRRIHLTADVDPALGVMHLDPMRLKQVLYNYLSNAIKFTQEGGRVVVRVRPDEGERFRIEVEDTGIGIKPEDQHRLFIEFQQLDATTAKKFAGSGLGLALTKRLVEAQGGTVGVRSVFGSGSTFFATLPQHVTAETADMAGTNASRAR